MEPDENGEKNAGAALAGGVLAASVDRLGLSAIVRPSQLLTPAGKKAAIDGLINAGKAATKEEAEQLLVQTTKREAYDLLKHQVASGQVQASAVVNRGKFVQEMAKGFAVGGAGEAATEAAQETIQYVAAKAGQGQDLNAWEIEDRVKDAALAAFGPGSAFGIGSSAINVAGYDALVRDLERGDIERLNAYDQIRERRRVDGEHIETVQEIQEENRAKRVAWDKSQEAQRDKEMAEREKGKRVKKKHRIGSFANRADRHKTNARGFYNTFKSLESIPDAVAKAATGMGKLWNSASVTAFSPQELADQSYGKTLQKIRALVGQGRGVIQSGRSFEAQQDLIYSTLAQQIYMPNITNRFGVKGTVSDAKKIDISRLLREYGRDGWFNMVKQGQEPDLPPHLAQHAKALKETAMELEKMADNIRQTQIDARKNDGKPMDEAEFGYLEGWWHRHQDLDPRKVYKNRAKFFDFLRTNTEMNEEEIPRLL